MERETIGILLMAYGTPASLDQVEEYYTHIRRGRKPAPEQLEDLINRYKAIGGVSPLNAITRSQAKSLEEQLNKETDGSVQFRVYLGMKHCTPFIHDAVEAIVNDGVQRVIGLVLAPHYSSMSIGTYIKAAEEAVARLGGPTFTYIRNWHMNPMFLDAVASRVRKAIDQFAQEQRNDVNVIFSAHSLPERILSIGDPYADQIKESGDAVAKRLSLPHWTYAWQSAGRTPDPWLGPDILEVLRAQREKGFTAIVSCPIGFVSDHLEVLYDIDIECQALCKELGIRLVRTESLNASPDFIAALVSVIRDHLAGETNDR
jgi:protoporphyrin/coproporphyrin ferrochelatase